MEEQGISANTIETTGVPSAGSQEPARPPMQQAARQKETVAPKTKAPASGGNREASSPPPEQHIAAAIATFADVYKLLEEYGPSWYSSKMRRKLQTTLRSMRYFMPQD